MFTFYFFPGIVQIIPFVKLGRSAGSLLVVTLLASSTIWGQSTSEIKIEAPDLPRQATCQATPIQSGQFVNGELKIGDCPSTLRGNDFFSDRYTFSGTAGQRVDILVTESKESIEVGLLSPALNPLARDSFDPWISTTLPSSGTFTIEVTTVFSNRTTAYSFRLNTECGAIALTNGQVVAGILDSSDCMSLNEDEHLADRYSFSGMSGQRVDILITESNLATEVFLLSPTGNPLVDDSFDPWISFILPATGIYTIEVTSVFTRKTGSFSLRFNIECLPSQITRGQVINGVLAAQDCMSLDEDEHFADRYTFAGSAGQKVEFALAESNFSAELILFSPTGNPLIRDSFDPMISTTLTTTGTFSIEVTTVSSRVIGSYSLTFRGDPDFSISLNPPQLTTSRGGKGTITVNVVRTGGFTGNIVVSPPITKPLKIKLTPSTPQTVPQTSVSFSFKVKNTASLGTQQLVFSASDGAGKIRTATLNFTIQ